MARGIAWVLLMLVPVLLAPASVQGRSLKQAPPGPLGAAPGPDPVPVPVTRPIQVFRENQDVTPGPGGAPAEDAEEQVTAPGPDPEPVERAGSIPRTFRPENLPGATTPGPVGAPAENVNAPGPDPQPPIAEMAEAVPASLPVENTPVTATASPGPSGAPAIVAPGPDPLPVQVADMVAAVQPRETTPAAGGPAGVPAEETPVAEGPSPVGDAEGPSPVEEAPVTIPEEVVGDSVPIAEGPSPVEEELVRNVVNLNRARDPRVQPRDVPPNVLNASPENAERGVQTNDVQQQTAVVRANRIPRVPAGPQPEPTSTPQGSTAATVSLDGTPGMLGGPVNMPLTPNAGDQGIGRVASPTDMSSTGMRNDRAERAIEMSGSMAGLAGTMMERMGGRSGGVMEVASMGRRLGPQK